MIIVQSVLKVWDSYCQDKIIFFFSEYCWSVPMFHLYGKIAWCAPLSPLLQTVLFQLHSGKWQRVLRMLLRIVVPKLWVATLVGHETKRKDCYAHQGVKNLKGAPLPNHHYSLALGYILGILGYILDHMWPGSVLLGISYNTPCAPYLCVVSKHHKSWAGMYVTIVDLFLLRNTCWVSEELQGVLEYSLKTLCIFSLFWDP